MHQRVEGRLGTHRGDDRHTASRSVGQTRCSRFIGSRANHHLPSHGGSRHDQIRPTMAWCPSDDEGDDRRCRAPTASDRCSIPSAPRPRAPAPGPGDHITSGLNNANQKLAGPTWAHNDDTCQTSSSATNHSLQPGRGSEVTCTWKGLIQRQPPHRPMPNLIPAVRRKVPVATHRSTSLPLDQRERIIGTTAPRRSTGLAAATTTGSSGSPAQRSPGSSSPPQPRGPEAAHAARQYQTNTEPMSSSHRQLMTGAGQHHGHTSPSLARFCVQTTPRLFDSQNFHPRYQGGKIRPAQQPSTSFGIADHRGAASAPPPTGGEAYRYRQCGSQEGGQTPPSDMADATPPPRLTRRRLTGSVATRLCGFTCSCAARQPRAGSHLSFSAAGGLMRVAVDRGQRPSRSSGRYLANKDTLISQMGSGITGGERNKSSTPCPVVNSHPATRAAPMAEPSVRAQRERSAHWAGAARRAGRITVASEGSARPPSLQRPRAVTGSPACSTAASHATYQDRDPVASEAAGCVAAHTSPVDRDARPGAAPGRGGWAPAPR